MGIPFRKLHGLGNDFVVVDGFDVPIPDALARSARDVCDRHLGVGADGVLLVARSDKADAAMRVINADGSEPQTCGNGLRCVAKLLGDHNAELAGREALTIETVAGVVSCTLLYGAGGRVARVRVDMGAASLERASLPMRGPGRFIDDTIHVDGAEFRGTAVSMGNPHLVIFAGSEDTAPRELAERYGPMLETHAAFPERTNVEFVHPRPDGALDLAVWERGCGLTRACGSGACATVVAAVVTERHAPDTPLEVHLPGGPLTITVSEDLGSVLMEGPACEVFSGELPADLC
ncbi:MAG: diaminopimelate epimerase [Myxococcales bacterium]|nr:diaminopimelate epimerase [Myxococcales bacterium]